MKAFRLFAAALAVVGMSAPLLQPATAEEGQRALPRRIELPRGWQPEGITTDGTSLYVGSIKNGAIWKADPGTGNGNVVAPGKKGRVAIGVDFDGKRGLLWVAGGPTGVVRAHNARTGKIVASYSFGSGRFLNDLTVTRQAVYATDSKSKQLAVVPLPDSGRLPPAGRARTLALTGDFQLVTGPNAFNLNGIVHDRGWLLAVQTVNGRLFRINPRTGRTVRVAVTGASLANGDGLERQGDTLYVVRNQNNKVVALDLGARLKSAKRIAVLTHRSLDVPATVAAARGALWAVNARFEITKPTRRTPYWITRLPLAR